MRLTLCAAAALALAVSVSLAAQTAPVNQPTPPRGPDLSGRWNRESVSGGTGTETPSWGSRVEIEQSGVNVSVRSPSGAADQYWLDGKEHAHVLSVKGCQAITRITKSVVEGDHLTITTWLANKPACVHGEDEDDPLIQQLGPMDADHVIGRRTLESISSVYRDGSALTVETTRSAPGGGATTTTTTYRR
jgi:hypothetical protein